MSALSKHNREKQIKAFGLNVVVFEGSCPFGEASLDRIRCCYEKKNPHADIVAYIKVLPKIYVKLT